MAIDREKNVQVWAVLDKEIYAELKRIAAEQDRTVSKQAAHIIRDYIINYRISKALNNNRPKE